MLTTILASLSFWALSSSSTVRALYRGQARGRLRKVFSIGFGKKLLRWRRGETVRPVRPAVRRYVKFSAIGSTDTPLPEPEAPRTSLDETPDGEIARATYNAEQVDRRDPARGRS
jgi:membrane-associated protease RseP (regulator of RpoE activity)